MKDLVHYTIVIPGKERVNMVNADNIVEQLGR